MLVKRVILITEDMGVLLICNLLQSQDASIQTNIIGSRVISDDLPSLGLLERRPETRSQQAIPLMPGSFSLGWATREMSTAFTMGGVSYLPWLVGSLEECPGEGYWLLFNQKLPISYELGISSMGCFIVVGWSGMRRMRKGRSQRMPSRRRSFNRPMFSPNH